MPEWRGHCVSVWDILPDWKLCNHAVPQRLLLPIRRSLTYSLHGQQSFLLVSCGLVRPAVVFTHPYCKPHPVVVSHPNTVADAILDAN